MVGVGDAGEDEQDQRVWRGFVVVGAEAQRLSVAASSGLEREPPSLGEPAAHCAHRGGDGGVGGVARPQIVDDRVGCFARCEASFGFVAQFRP